MRFYLAIVVQGEEDVVVVFPVCFYSAIFSALKTHSLFNDDIELNANHPQHLLPRRHILEDVWRGAKRCLYEQESRGKS